MSHLNFEETMFSKAVVHSGRRKTRLYDVRSVSSGERLGQVRWYARWRQFTFFPAALSIWNPDCLREIAGFCEERTREHKT